VARYRSAAAGCAAAVHVVAAMAPVGSQMNPAPWSRRPPRAFWWLRSATLGLSVLTVVVCYTQLFVGTGGTTTGSVASAGTATMLAAVASRRFAAPHRWPATTDSTQMQMKRAAAAATASANAVILSAPVAGTTGSVSWQLSRRVS
jgi:hypothetical protein